MFHYKTYSESDKIMNNQLFHKLLVSITIAFFYIILFVYYTEATLACKFSERSAVTIKIKNTIARNQIYCNNIEKQIQKKLLTWSKMFG